MADFLRYSAPAMDLLLFGIQGGGKGTQAKKLVERFGFHHFETGGELRKIIASGTELGKKVSSYLDNGLLAPNDVTMQVVEAVFHSIPAGKPILFDGIPRFAEQQETFDALMAKNNREFRGIELTVNEELAIQRILQRGKEQGRVDDQDEGKIRTRMGWTKEKTQPVIEVYRSRGIIETVDGDAPVDEVFERIVVAMEKLGFTVR